MHTASTAAPTGATPLVRRLGALAAAAVVGIALAGCVASPDVDEQQPTTTADGTESQAPEETTEEAEEEGDPGVGDVVSADGWDFTVVSVGEPQPSVGTPCSTPQTRLAISSRNNATSSSGSPSSTPDTVGASRNMSARRELSSAAVAWNAVQPGLVASRDGSTTTSTPKVSRTTTRSKRVTEP